MTEKTPISPKILQQLQALLKEECRLYEEYIQVLSLERKALTHFEPATVVIHAARRNELTERLNVVAVQRAELTKHFPQGDSVKLSQIIARFCDKEDARKILPLVARLRSLVQEAQSKGKEFTQVLSFSQRLVEGTLSILWSATQSITQLYTRKGEVKDSYTPQGGRRSSSLKQA